jgi:hypothetical protein
LLFFAFDEQQTVERRPDEFQGPRRYGYAVLLTAASTLFVG